MKPYFVFACMFLLRGLYAQPQNYDPESSPGQLFEYATYADAGKQAYTPEEIMGSEFLTFLPLTSENRPVGFTSSYYWVRFCLTNSSNTTKTYNLETARPMTDLARLYQNYPNGYSAI